MLYTKSTLKHLLEYAKNNYNPVLTERELIKEIKCSSIEYELYGDEISFNKIFLCFLSLCIIKC